MDKNKENKKDNLAITKIICPVKTAILVDGGFYRRRAQTMLGEVTPAERAEELNNYCLKHLSYKNDLCSLYRIFYYDCLPMEKKLYIILF